MPAGDRRSEAVDHFARLGADRARIDALLAGLPICYVEPDKALA